MNTESQLAVASMTLKLLETALSTRGLEQLTPAQLERFAERCGYWLQTAATINRRRKTTPPTHLRPRRK